MEWLDAQIAETLFLTTVTLAEVRHGIARAQRFGVASRDTTPFEAAGVVSVIDPFGQARRPLSWS